MRFFILIFSLFFVSSGYADHLDKCATAVNPEGCKRVEELRYEQKLVDLGSSAEGMFYTFRDFFVHNVQHETLRQL